ncbi:CDP-alcohol phosphatidyltransferase family protein [Pelagibacterales bacterium SAG-MED21]|nr:CDP-alcohol phosphatidyltransferase family protein [Pelagibacterales bacterium SAG-MED21]
MKKIHTQYIKKFYREIGDFLAPHFTKYGISANQITLSRIFFVLFGSILILNNSFIAKIFTLLFFLIFSLFDAADGSLARITKKSQFGMWFDTVIDRIGLLIIFIFFGIKISLVIESTYLYIFINFLILNLYLIKFSILSDISVKDKYASFRDYNKELGIINDPSKDTYDKLEIYSFNYLKVNLTLNNFLRFMHHQFSPHTANLIMYMGLINLLNLYKIGLSILALFFIIWIIADIYKITLISLKLDENEKNND